MAEDSFELNEINQLIESIRPLPDRGSGASDPLLTWLGNGQQTEVPHLDHPRLSLFSANHGFAQALNITREIDYGKYLQGCLQGTGRINRLALAANTDLRLYEMDPEASTENVLEADASLSSSDLVRSMAYGMMAVEPGIDLLSAGAFGEGSSLASQALIALHLNQASNDINVARLLKQAKGTAGLAALEKIGGYELAALCGAIIAARLAHCPVLLEGPQGYAAFLILEAENKALTDHCRLCGVDRILHQAFRLDLPTPATSNAEPGITLACIIPLLRTHVIMNEPGEASVASGLSKKAV